MRWAVSKLEAVLDMYQPKTIAQKEMVEDGKFPVFGANGQIGWHDEFNHEEPEVLLTCRGATCGFWNWSLPNSWINGNAMVMRPKDSSQLSQEFLFKALEGGVDITKAITGSAQPQITRKSLNPLCIPIPPLEEQERIVGVLDEAFAAIDKAKANIERNLSNARELFQSRLNDIFSNPSEDWEVASLGEACVFIDYRGRTPKKTDAGIRLITAKNVRMGYVKTDPQEFMSSDEYEDWMTRGIPKKGDVLFTTEAPLANVAVFDFTEKVALAQRIITLSPKLGLSGEFLSFHLQSRPSQLEILGQATGATVSGIKSRLLKLIKIAFPSLESQNFIVDHLGKLKQEVTRLEADYLSELDNLEELRQSILEQAFEGKLTEPVAA